MSDGRSRRRGRVRGAIRAVVLSAATAALGAAAFAGDVTVSRVAGQVFVQGGSEDDRIVLSSPSEGVLRIEGEDASTTFDGERGRDLVLRPRDAVYVLLGDGTNSVTLDSLPTMRRCVVLGGRNADTLLLRGPDLRGGLVFAGQEGSDRVTLASASRLAGELLALMGEGSDTFEATEASVTRELVVDLGGGDLDQALLDRFTAGSTLTVLGRDGDDSVRVSGGSVRRLAQIDLGAGDDSLTVDAAAHFGGRLRVHCGDGSDVVTVAGAATFAQTSLIDLGPDDDVVSVGAAQFSRQLRLAGGAGRDRFELSQFEAPGGLAVFCGPDADEVTVDDAAPFLLGSEGGMLDGGTGRDTRTGGNSTGAVFRRFEAFATD